MMFHSFAASSSGGAAFPSMKRERKIGLNLSKNYDNKLYNAWHLQEKIKGFKLMCFAL